MQSPASSIQSPRPQGWQQQYQQPGAFEKELMASLHVLLNQLGEVERQGLVMFHKIEESFKHPYTQQEAIADTANLLIQLDTLSTQAKTTGFGALTTLPTSQTVASTPSSSAIPTATTPGPSGNSAAAGGGTPKPMFLSPRMQNHIHNNQHNNNNITTGINTAAGGAGGGGAAAGSGSDSQMMSPTPVSVVGTPSASQASVTGTGTGTGVGSPSPFPTSDILMSATTPIADPNHPATGNAAGTAGTTTGTATATPATPSAWSSNPSAALAQMLDARQKDVQALSNEKRKLKINFKIAAQMTKI